MDSDRFEVLVRSLGQTQSRRQAMRGLAGAGALVALLAATPVAARKTGKSTSPKKGGKNPSKSQPGSGQNGGGGLGAVAPSPTCKELCEEQFDDCTRNDLDPDYCEDDHLYCIAQCPTA